MPVEGTRRAVPAPLPPGREASWTPPQPRGRRLPTIGPGSRRAFAVRGAAAAQRPARGPGPGAVLGCAAPRSSIARAYCLAPMSPIEEHLMSTSESFSTSPQEQYLDAVREGQEAWANAVRAWSESVQRMWGDPSSTTTREAPTAEQGHRQRVWVRRAAAGRPAGFRQAAGAGDRPGGRCGSVQGEVDDQEGDLLASILTAASVVLVARRHDPRGQGSRPMTAALATRARRQEALDGRWLLEPVLLVGGCRRPAVGLDGFGRAGGRGAHTRPPGAYPLYRPRRRAHPVPRYEADPLYRLTPPWACSTAGRSTFRRAAADSGADGSAVRSARRAQRRRGKCASHS